MKLGAMNNPQRPLLEEIRWIADNKFDFIDLALEAPGAALESTDWKAVRQAIADAGLSVICHAAQYLPVENPSPLVRQAALDEWRRSIDAAHLLGASLCTLRFRGWPAHLSEKAGYEFAQQLYGIAVQHGAERGVDVALENSPRNQHQLKYFREIFHRVPQLKLLYDIGHGNVGTHAPHTTRDYLFALSERLAHVHISDNDGSEDAHLPPGAPASGGINLRWELQTLQSFGYDGTITVQVRGDRRWLLASADLIREEWAHGQQAGKQP